MPADFAPPGLLLPNQDPMALTGFEKFINRLFAVFLVLSSVMLLLSIYVIPTVIIFLLFASFLWFSKKYRPLTNLFFLALAWGVYCVPYPLMAWGFFPGLKEFRVEGFYFAISTFFFIAPYIFIALSARNVLGNIAAYFKPYENQRNIIYVISLILTLGAVLIYPLVDPIRLRDHAIETSDGTSALAKALTIHEDRNRPALKKENTAARDYTAEFDTTSQQYAYRLNLTDPLKESITFVALKIDGEKVNFRTDMRVDCPNCQIKEDNPYSLIFPAGKPIDFVTTSNVMIEDITFFESGDQLTDFAFWK